MGCPAGSSRVIPVLLESTTYVSTSQPTVCVCGGGGGGGGGLVLAFCYKMAEMTSVKWGQACNSSMEHDSAGRDEGRGRPGRPKAK